MVLARLGQTCGTLAPPRGIRTGDDSRGRFEIWVRYAGLAPRRLYRICSHTMLPCALPVMAADPIQATSAHPRAR